MQGITLTKTELAKRNWAIVAMYLENHTLAEVGQRFGGLSRERVRQIINQMGFKPRSGTELVFRETLSNTRPHRYTLKERFYSYVNVQSTDECWEWQGSKHPKSGYGSFSATKLGEYYAHRISYIIHNKKRPKNNILHSCDNPPCVNPFHLRDGTQAENVADRQNRNYDVWYKELMVGMQKNAKYSQIEIEQMVAYRRDGLSYAKIAKIIGANPGAVYQILNGKTIIYKKFL